MEEIQHPAASEPQESPAAAEASDTPSAPPFPVQEEKDLNDLFPDTGQDLNDLFPEKELRTLLRKVHKSKSDLHKINTRFEDNTEHVVPHREDAEPDPEGPE